MVSAAATPRFDSRTKPRHVHELSPLVVFAPFWMHMHEVISFRALHVHYALIDMMRRRHIGGHRLTDIHPDELARYLSDKPAKEQTWHHHKRNRLAIGELLRSGLWYDTDFGYQPALSLDHLRIDCRDLEDWMAERPLNRRSLLVPRLLFEQFPRLEKGPLAINLELASRCFWIGDRTETTATTTLKAGDIGDIAERWRIDPHTVYNVLHRQGLGANVRLEAIDSLSYHRKEYGCRYRVVIGKGAGNRASTPADSTPVPIRRAVTPKTADSESEPVHQIPDSESEPVHQIPDFLKVVLLLLLRGGIKSTLNPPDAAQNPTTAGDTIAAIANPMSAENKTGFYQIEDEGEEQAADLAPLTDRTPADTIAPAEEQKSTHEGDTTAVPDTADTTSSPDTTLVVEALPSADLVTHADTAGDPTRPAVVVDTLPAAVSVPAADAGRPPVETTEDTLAVVNMPCPDASVAHTAPSADDAPIGPPAIPSAEMADDGTPRPDWDRMDEAYLRDVAYLDPLYEQVISRGIIRRSQSTRLDFVCAAVHALRVANNPPALFRHTVENDRWERLTDADEQVARDMLRKHHEPPVWRRHLHAVPKPTPPLPDASHNECPSDIEIVETVYQVLNEQRDRGDYFLRFKATDEGRSWDRARWDAAVAQSKIRSGVIDACSHAR